MINSVLKTCKQKKIKNIQTSLVSSRFSEVPEIIMDEQIEIKLTPEELEELIDDLPRILSWLDEEIFNEVSGRKTNDFIFT